MQVNAKINWESAVSARASIKIVIYETKPLMYVKQQSKISYFSETQAS